MLALTSSAGVVLAVIGSILVVAAVAGITLRGRGRPSGPDIPNAMRPGPSDPALETPLLQKLQGWGVLLVAFFGIWIPYVWLREPSTNLSQERELKTAAIDRGHRATLFYSEDNQLGVGCVRCHGPQLTGGVIQAGDSYAYPPNLQTICGGNLVTPAHANIASVADIYQVIEQGRPPEKPIMPSWSIRYGGALDDQQINDIVNYLVSMSSQHVPYAQNICINPAAVKQAQDLAATQHTVLERP
ncbi:MAG: cytochrome c [Actinomycetota bacterium]|nr:cytochrome c [Actinomycetota bacterium]